MIKIGMCDDNLDSIRVVGKHLQSEMIEQDFDADVVLITDSQKEIFDAIYKREIDILILDVDFKNKGKNGIEFAKDLRAINKEFYLIFLSAHFKYMTLSFSSKVFDYLVKPINQATLQTLVTRLKDEFEMENNVFLHLNKWVSVRNDDILYIEKDRNNCIVITKESRHTTSKTLEKLLQELPNNFRKCHRSYIVNENNILSVDKKLNYISFARGLRCPINAHFEL